MAVMSNAEWQAALQEGTKPDPPVCYFTGPATAAISTENVTFPWNWTSWEIEYIVALNPFFAYASWVYAKTINNPNKVTTHEIPNFSPDTQFVMYRYRIRTGSTVSNWSTGVKPAPWIPGGVPGTGTVRKYTTLIGNSSTTAFIIPHGLASRDVSVTVYDVATSEIVYPSAWTIDASYVILNFGTAPSTDQYRVVIMG